MPIAVFFLYCYAEFHYCHYAERHFDKCPVAECHYADCCAFNIVMLSVMILVSRE
jgi:hypothetical protein